MNHEQSSSGRRVRSCDLDSVSEAVDAFGEDDGLLVCRIRKSKNKISRWCGLSAKLAPFFTVPEGYHALVQRGGKDADFADGSATWPAGLHWGVPWLRVMYLVTKQSVVYDCDVKHCITRDNVPVVLRATAVFRVLGDIERGEDPALVRKFVYELGVRGLETQLANAVEEGIRVMARAVRHETVYALASGGRAACRPFPPTPHVTTPCQPTLINSTTTAAAVERENRSTIKRTQVAPESQFSAGRTHTTLEPSTGDVPSVAATIGTIGCEATTPNSGTGVGSASLVDVSGRSASPPQLPVIQRGLRASRVVPSDAVLAGEGLLSVVDDARQTQVPDDNLEVCLDLRDRRRVYPVEGRTQETRTDESVSGGGDVLESLVSSRPLPLATNLDLSPSPTLSESSSLPKLELAVARPSPVPNLSKASLSVADSCVSQGEENGSNSHGDYNQEEGGARGRNGIVARTRERGDIRTHTYDGGELGDTKGEKPPATTEPAINSACDSSQRRAASSASAAPAATTHLESNISLGRRHAEHLRDLLNRTLSPQGVEVTAVMIRSAELPSDIAEQMSGRTQNVSLAEEQRAVKRAHAQSVRHKEEVLGLRQLCEIERALAVREGDEDVEKARARLRLLRARADATARGIAANAAVTAQCITSEAQREVFRSRLRETAETSEKACLADRAAGIVKAKTDAYRMRRESEAGLEVVQNAARARELVDAAEGKGAWMLRAARAYLVDNKRLEVWNSLANNDLALVTSSPLVTSEAETSALKKKQSVHALTALMLGEAGFRNQMLEASPSVGVTDWSRLAARQRKRELEAQLAFVSGGRGASGTSSMSQLSFAVILNNNRRFSSSSARSGRCGNNNASCKTFREEILKNENVNDGGVNTCNSSSRDKLSATSGVRSSSSGVANVTMNSSSSKAVAVDENIVLTPRKTNEEALLLERQQGKERGRQKLRPRQKRGGKHAADASSTGAVPGDGGADCELCVIRDGVPYRLVHGV